METSFNVHKRQISRIVVFAVIGLMLSSCAGLMIGGEAQTEFDKGLALFNQGQFKEAVPYFERAVSLEPNFYQAHLYLGRRSLRFVLPIGYRLRILKNRLSISSSTPFWEQPFLS
jgi:tetratricopeptide (TPR) repeat protein